MLCAHRLALSDSFTGWSLVLDRDLRLCRRRVSADHGDAQYARDAHQRRFDHPGRRPTRSTDFSTEDVARLEDQHGELYAAHPAEVRHAELHSRQRRHPERASSISCSRRRTSSEQRPLTAYYVTRSFVTGRDELVYLPARSGLDHAGRRPRRRASAPRTSATPWDRPTSSI